MHTVLFNMKLLWAVLQQGLHNVVSQQHCSATCVRALCIYGKQEELSSLFC